MKTVLYEVSKRRGIALLLVLCMILSLLPAEFNSAVAQDVESYASLKFNTHTFGDAQVSFSVYGEESIVVDKNNADLGGAVWVRDIEDGAELEIVAKGDNLSGISVVYEDVDMSGEQDEENELGECQEGEDGEIIYSFTAYADEVYSVKLQFDDSKEDNPAGDDLDEDDPAENDPAGDDSDENDPAGDDSDENDPAGDDSAENDPAGDDPAGDEPGGDEPDYDNPDDVVKQYYEIFLNEGEGNPYINEDTRTEKVKYTLEGEADFTINDSEETGLGTNDKQEHYISFNYDEEKETVDFYFSSLYVFQYKSIKINGIEYVSGTNGMVVGGVELTEEYLLNHFYRQKNFFKIEVEHSNRYDIVVERVDALTDDYIVIGNFLWTEEEAEADDPKKDDSIFGGSIEIVKAIYNDKVLYDEANPDNNMLEENSAIDWVDSSCTDNQIGSAVFPAGTKLTVRLVPDSGKQLVNFGVNGRDFTPDKDNVSTYTFTVAKGNFHLCADFEEVDNIVVWDEESDNILGVDCDAYGAVDAGTAKVTVEETQADNNVEEAILAVDITLENIFYAGEDKIYDNWTKTITEPENNVSISLDIADIDEYGEYYIIREHEGQEAEIIDDVTVYAGAISFETDKFSKFTIVGHAHECVCELEDAEVEEATCDETGCITYYCTICGEFMYDEEIPELGHKWDKGKVTTAATLDKKGVKTYTCSRCDDKKKVAIAKVTVKKNQKFKDSKNIATYKILDVKKRTVEFVAPVKKTAAKITVPDTVVIYGAKFKVVKIGAKAFNKNNKLTTIVVGKNVAAIGKQAFANCGKLKNITFKGTALVAKSIDKQAFKGVSKKVTIKVSKKKVLAYDTLFKTKGLNESVVVKK